MAESKRTRFALYNCIAATLLSLYALVYVLVHGRSTTHVAMAAVGFMVFLGLLVGVVRTRSVEGHSAS